MKVKIKTYNGELPSYLTSEKEYEVIWQYGHGVVDVIADNKITTTIDINDCYHLDGGSWEIVE